MDIVEHPGPETSLHLALPDGSVNLVVHLPREGHAAEAMVVVAQDPADAGETQRTTVVSLPWSALRALVNRAGQHPLLAGTTPGGDAP